MDNSWNFSNTLYIPRYTDKSFSFPRKKIRFSRGKNDVILNDRFQYVQWNYINLANSPAEFDSEIEEASTTLPNSL